MTKGKNQDKKVEERTDYIMNKWLKIGVSTGLCNRKEVEKLVPQIYKAGGEPPPEIIYWTKSPLGGAILSAILEQEENLNLETKEEIINLCLNGSDNRSVEYIIKNKNDRNLLRPRINNLINFCGYGIHDTAWMGYYDFAIPFSEDKAIHKLEPLIEFSQHVLWYWPFDRAIVISERPIYHFRDEQLRLHHETQAALEFADGFKFFMWHGVEVPEYIILNPEQITTKKVVKEGNQELRRIMLERYGWDKLLIDLKATKEHEDSFGCLYSTNGLGKFLDREDSIAKFVLVQDSSTDRQYCLRVDPKSMTAHEGVASTFGKTKEQYNPSQQT